jgi:hypothetical protein
MIDLDALTTVTGGAGSLLGARPPPQEQVLYDHALAYLNGTAGGSWQLGAAHHQGLKMDAYRQAGDSTAYKAVFANNGDHTAQVLMNPNTGEVVRRLP